MSLLRPLINLVLATVYLVRSALFLVTRICGSIPGMIVIIGGTILWMMTHREEPVLFYVPIFFAFLCRGSYPHLRVARPRFWQAPPPPAAPPPSASTAKGRSDDPSEATVIGRLDPKLRDLLRPKSDEKTS